MGILLDIFECFFKVFLQSILSQVHAIVIIDGCVQEFSQIDDAIGISFPNAFRVRCGFHLVKMGWKTKIVCRNSYPKLVHQIYDTFCNHLKLWIYSWMTYHCENEMDVYFQSLLIICIFDVS